MSAFEGSYMGDAARIGPNARLECGVCWWVYDPAQGDAEWQIPAGTAFNDLPKHWRCPKCDAEKAKFMVIAPGAAAAEVAGAAAGPEIDPAERIAAMRAAYEAADGRMRALPVHNAALSVEMVGFRRFGQTEMAGVVLTPWAMNLTILTLDPHAAGRPEGSKRFRPLPSGEYEFVASTLDGVGAIESCSLFSPMEEFDDMAVARAVAEHAIQGAFEAPPAPPVEPVSRRGFLTGASG